MTSPCIAESKTVSSSSVLPAPQTPSQRERAGTVSLQDSRKATDAAEVCYDGWVKAWENDKTGIPAADRKWLKQDTDRGMFGPSQLYKDITGVYKKRRVLKSDCMWFYPPEPPGASCGHLPVPDQYFRSRVFFWRPVGVWKYSIRCPRPNCPGRHLKDVYLHRSGYHSSVRQVCDISGWYTMLTEVLACGPCNKAVNNKEAKWGRFLAWDMQIISQLSEAHQALFPAVLTAR